MNRNQQTDEALPRTKVPVDTRLAALDSEALCTEILRLRSLVGPDEYAYHELKLELWAARDLVVGKDAELGNVRGRCTVLDREIFIRDTEINKLRDQIAGTTPPVPSVATTLRKTAGALRDLRR